MTRKHRLHRHADRVVVDFGRAVTIVAGALPVALVAAPAPFQVIGWIYAFVYFVAVLVVGGSTALAVIYDAVLMMTEREPITMPTAIEGSLRLRRSKRPLPPEARAMYVLALILDRMNPFQPLALGFLYMSIIRRPHQWLHVVGDAVQRAQRDPANLSTTVVPMVALTRPTVEQAETWEPELCVA